MIKKIVFSHLSRLLIATLSLVNCRVYFIHKINYKISTMLCPPINQTLPNYPFQESNRNKVPDKLPKFHEGTTLENKAYANLCQLSQTICQQQPLESVRGPINKQENVPFSPWKLKSQENILEASLSKARKQIHQKKDRKYSLTKHSYHNTEDKQNSSSVRCSGNEQIELKRYPSIFMKLLAAKQIRTSIKAKKDDPEIEIVTCMKRKKIQASETLDPKLDIKDAHEVASQIIRSNLNKARGCHDSKKSLSKLTVNAIPNNLFQPDSEQIKKDINKHSEHWRTKSTATSKKCQKSRRQSKADKENRSVDDKESQSVCISKKASFSFQKPRKEYHTNNPLTRLLYEKYLNTINISHSQKPQKFKFL